MIDVSESQVQLRTGSPPAPGKLVLLEGFLNTWSGELDFEDLATAKATEAWLRSTGLWSGSEKLTSKQHQKIVQFRNDLRSWILDSKEFQSLTELLEEITFSAHIGADGDVHFQPSGNAAEIVIATLTQAIFESQQNGTWERMKCCQLPSCGWAFYDSTRSRTKRWCSMKTCGSRHKAREYYKRKR